MEYPKNTFPGGVWPVMLTPFTEDNEIDEAGLRRLVDWYIENGVTGLFAACQSSEIFNLTFEECKRIISITIEQTGGRVPVVASGIAADGLKEQAEEINQVWELGVDAVILLTNRLASKKESDEKWLENYYKLEKLIGPEIKLGVYECPQPYKRLLSVKVLKEISKTNRFYFLKDTCCTASVIREKLESIKGTNLKLYNANATTVLQSLRDGAAGYSGVMANFHPELWVWLTKKENFESKKAEEVQEVLMAASLIERQLYPANAKYHLQAVENLPITTRCRNQDYTLLYETWKEEVHMLDSLCTRTYEQYCK
ncbi:dihydrodipicolinate synthase family protein [Clostridium sp. C105KSO13]|uniref:dihydrodipicolinate synthase family protein n=1 Tax=Clostridium sp. C105KSO13 TaxID=1776045 RepID=UPI00074081E9|nr:dihydrodipicolinate synthase family protein [Clostridium sp. C105KSO13]CUX16414.1 4-hydroxy-tetrahydrodipicolinate synthase [Clostridium sp. C105KSO13]